MKPTPRLFRIFQLLLLASSVLLADRAAAQIATGTIEGRVYDAARGMFLENAHVTLEGTAQEAFTDSAGQFRLTNVPAGEARVKVFFTGLQTQTALVRVTAGQVAQQNINLLPRLATR
jgi:iron complex outermembrane recepter protein